MDARYNALVIWDKRPDGGGKTTWDNVGSRNLVGTMGVGIEQQTL